jgi:hypothetical protein
MDTRSTALQGRFDRKASWPAAMLLLSAVIIPGGASADQVYKWVDRNGETHYSDHPPADQSTTTVSVRKIAAPAPAAPRSFSGVPSASAYAGNGVSGYGDPEVLRRSREQQQRMNTATANQGKATDQQLIDACKAQRDTDCGRLDELRRREAVANAPPPMKSECITLNTGEKVGCHMTQLPPEPVRHPPWVRSTPPGVPSQSP